MSGPCAIGTTLRRANMYKAPYPAQLCRFCQDRGGKEKCHRPEEPAGFLRCLLRKEKHFIARSVGISVLGRSVNLIQEYTTIYEEMKGLSLLPVNLIATTPLISTVQDKR